MNKQEQHNAGDPCNQTKPVMAAQVITETMENPEFGADQLPALWQQVTEPDGTLPSSDRRNRWHDGIETMYRRCETYPQHAKLTAVRSGTETPNRTWYDTGWVSIQARDLLRQATPTQLQQALDYEQQHPGSKWRASEHILKWANMAQLTGQIIEQLEWNDGLAACTATPEKPTTDRDRWRHIAEQIQQQLLNSNDDVRTVFHGIVEPGNRIGAIAELAIAIEQKHRAVR